jgi:Transposase.
MKFSPKLLTVKQKVTCLAVARDLLPCADQYTNFMKTVITSDESWIYGYDPETEVQSSQRQTVGSSRPKTARKVQNQVKVMLTVFFDDENIIHHENTPDDRTVNKKYYVQFLHWLHDAVQCK